MKAKFWIYYVGCVLPLLLVPGVCLAITMRIQIGLLGNNYPMGAMLFGGVAGVVLMLVLWIRLMFMVGEAEIKEVQKFFFGLLGFEVLAIGLTFLIMKLGTPEIYDRESLAFEFVEKPTIDFSGTWEGSWADSRKDETMKITLVLSQAGSSVEGSIVDGSGVEWRVIEGVVSGSKINIFYERSGAWPGAGATLLGDFEGGTVFGNYFAHDAPRTGWASKGAWEATRTSTVESDERKGD